MKQILIGGSHYSLRDPLGSGGMAEVFLARDEVLERDVALKILKEQYADNVNFVERFRREARSAASLNHPRIIIVYDWGRSAEGTYCMAMEYASGGTLKDRILEDGPLPPRKAAKVASQIAEGLGFAHERGVIHRDVKPQHVLLTEAGDAKVADFGIARAATATTTSQSKRILGTAGYMSPEQAKGGRMGPASDLYSLGVVLYEMLTGKLPYEAEDPVALAMKHVAEPLRSPREANPEVPEVLEVLTLRLLAKDPTDRYGSATELLEDLRRVRDGLPPAFANGDPAEVDRAGLPAPSVPASSGVKGVRGRPYVVYEGRLRNLPLALAGASVALLLVLLGAAVWGPWWGPQALARAQDVARGPLDGLGEASGEDEGVTGSKDDLEVGDLLEDEGRKSSKAAPGSPKPGVFAFTSGDTVLRSGADDQENPGANIPAELGTKVVSPTVGSVPERVSVPKVLGESVEQASRALSDAGHVVRGTATRRSSEPAGTVVGTDPAVGSAVERGTAVAIMVSSGPASQAGSNGGEDAVPAVEETIAPTQPPKTKKRDQKPLTAVFAKAESAN